MAGVILQIIKYSLYLGNLMIFIFAAFILGAGIYAWPQTELISLGSNTILANISFYFLFLGSLTLIFSLLGCLGSLTLHKIILLYMLSSLKLAKNGEIVHYIIVYNGVKPIGCYYYFHDFIVNLTQLKLSFKNLF